MLVVYSLSEDGDEQKHFRLAATPPGDEVSFWDSSRWKTAPIHGTLEEVIDQLASSGASRMAPPRGPS